MSMQSSTIEPNELGQGTKVSQDHQKKFDKGMSRQTSKIKYEIYNNVLISFNGKYS